VGSSLHPWTMSCVAGGIRPEIMDSPMTSQQAQQHSNRSLYAPLTDCVTFFSAIALSHVMLVVLTVIRPNAFLTWVRRTKSFNRSVSLRRSGVFEMRSRNCALRSTAKVRKISEYFTPSLLRVGFYSRLHDIDMPCADTHGV
jgi:hypothetical protein